MPAEWIRISQGRRGTAHTNFDVGPFSHLMSCGVPGCGSTIIYDPKTKINKTAGTSRQFHYYHCADGRRFHKINQLRQVNMNEAKLWELFIEPIREITITEELADFIIDHLNQIKKDSTESIADTKARARDRAAQLSLKEDEIYDHWASGLLTKDAYTRHLEKLKFERQEIEDKLASLENIDESKVEEKAKSLLELCKRAESAWNKGDSDERLLLVKRFCSNFRLSGASLCYDLKTPFKKLLELKRNSDISKWCAKGDLNPHTLRHMHLKHACLPFHHPRT